MYVALQNTRRHSLAVSMSKERMIGEPGQPESSAHARKSVCWNKDEVVLIDENVLTDEPMIKDYLDSGSLVKRNKAAGFSAERPVPSNGKNTSKKKSAATPKVGSSEKSPGSGKDQTNSEKSNTESQV